MYSISLDVPSTLNFPMEWWLTIAKRFLFQTTVLTASKSLTTKVSTSDKLVEKVSKDARTFFAKYILWFYESPYNSLECFFLVNYLVIFYCHYYIGITNYPIGVGINAAGEVIIADNHNNFNLSVFSQEGQLLAALESKVKHAQCFDVSLMDDGSVVLASKDYRLYIYRYVQVPPVGL